MKVGMFNVPLDRLDLVADMGVTYVHTYHLSGDYDRFIKTGEYFTHFESYCRKCRERKLKVLMHFPDVWFDSKVHVPENLFSKLIDMSIEYSDVILSWYLDEPESTLDDQDIPDIRYLSEKLAQGDKISVASCKWVSHLMGSYRFGYLTTDSKMILMPSKYMFRRDHINPSMARFLLRYYWETMWWNYEGRLSPIVQVHDCNLWDSDISPYKKPWSWLLNRKGYRNPSEEDVKFQIDYARSMGSRTVWFWGFHVSEELFVKMGQHSLYLLESVDYARRMVDYALSIKMEGEVPVISTVGSIISP